MGQDLVDHAVFGGLFGRHEIIAVGVLGNLVHRATRLLGQNLVQALT